MEDSTVYQLTDIYNTFCRALDNGMEVRAIFVILAKRSTGYGIRAYWLSRICRYLGSSLRWFSDYLENRKQRVVLPGALSNWAIITAGVPHVSILWPLLFLIYINDIVIDINSYIWLFSYDTTLYIIVDTPAQAALTLNQDLVSWAVYEKNDEVMS